MVVSTVGGGNRIQRSFAKLTAPPEQ